MSHQRYGKRGTTLSDKVKIGIIGTGMIGKKHIQKYREIPGVEIVAVCDQNETEAAKAGEMAGAKQVVTDYKELLKIDEIQAVDVCLHNNLHAGISIAAMNAGKNVYCEKPLAGSYSDAKLMVEASARTGAKLMMQCATIFSQTCRSAKQLIDEGCLGKIYHAKSLYYRRRGRPYVDGYGTMNFVQKRVSAGGALFDMGVYHITQMLHLMGNPGVVTVSGATSQEMAMDETRRTQSGYDVEEFGTGFVRLEGGISLYIEEAWALYMHNSGSYKDKSTISGSLGGITLDPLTLHTTIAGFEADSTFSPAAIDAGKPNPYPGPFDPDLSQQHHWIAYHQGRVELLDTITPGLNMLKIAEGIYMSQQLGREVRADEIEQASVSTMIQV